MSLSNHLHMLVAAALFVMLPAHSQSFAAPAAKPIDRTSTHIIVPENTLICVRTDQVLTTRRVKDGQAILFTLSEDVILNHAVIIPRGAAIHGEVIRNKKAGTLGGTPELTLKLDSLELGGQSYPLYSYQFRVSGETKEKPDPTALIGTAEYGAIIGGILANNEPTATPASVTAGAGVGAGIGAGVVVAAKALEPKPIIKIPAESQLDFYLAAPMSIQPMPEREAARLAQRVNPAGPVLFVHGERP